MIDHLVYATPDLATTVEALTDRFGIVPTPGGAHPGRGTRNALVGLGDGAYLEIIGPDPEQPVPALPRPFGIDALSGAALVTWCARPSLPLEVVIEAASANGYDLGPIVAMSRHRPDGVLLEWRLSVTRQRRRAVCSRSLSTGTPRRTRRRRFLRAFSWTSCA